MEQGIGGEYQALQLVYEREASTHVCRGVGRLEGSRISAGEGGKMADSKWQSRQCSAGSGLTVILGPLAEGAEKLAGMHGTPRPRAVHSCRKPSVKDLVPQPLWHQQDLTLRGDGKSDWLTH